MSIDAQNAKQIRDPMNVRITMSWVAPESTATCSNYAADSKITDNMLDQQYSDYPMRALTDLQGDGFKLDGSCVLYDSSVSPSIENGKIGARGTVDQTFSIDVALTRPDKGVSMYITGAETATINGTTYNLYDGWTPFGDVNTGSFSLTLTPMAGRRIEIGGATAGVFLTADNRDIVKAVLSLRSDLSRYNQTLPASELNADIYYDIDISSVLAIVPEETLVTYQAGYADDMTEPRKFYLEGQATWDNNLLSITAVDAVHKLEKKLTAFTIGLTSTVKPTDLYYTAYGLIKSCGVDVEYDYIGQPFYSQTSESRRVVSPDGLTCREFISALNNYITINNIPVVASSDPDTTEYVINYVDGGLPRLRATRNRPGYIIYEEDCGNVDESIERYTTAVNATTIETAFGTVLYSPILYGTEVGEATWFKDGGIAIDLNDNVYNFAVGIPGADIGKSQYFVPIGPVNDHGESYTGFFRPKEAYEYSFDSNVTGLANKSNSAGELLSYIGADDYAKVYPSFIDWNEEIAVGQSGRVWGKQSDAWTALVNDGYIEADAGEFALKVYGYKLSEENAVKTYYNGDPGLTGVPIDIELPFFGSMNFVDINGTFIDELYPKLAVESVFDKSVKTGSFKWKGDPRMQPRDVVTFVRLDGSLEMITLENITITHETGGTVADITYRKGVV